MEAEIIPQVVSGTLIALVIYHGFMWTLRRHFQSETHNAMRWLAASVFFVLVGVFVVWTQQA